MMTFRAVVAALIGLFAIYLPMAIWLERSYVDDRPRGQLVIPLYPPFSSQGGNAFLANHLLAGDAQKLADIGNNPTVEADMRSPVRIIEGRTEIGDGRATFAEIHAGHGRFNNWTTGLFFSSSDNTNPNNNGRTYWAVCVDRCFLEE